MSKDLKALAKETYNQGNLLKSLKLIDEYLQQNKVDDEAILFKAILLQDTNIWGYLDEKTQKIDPLNLVNQCIKLNPKNVLAWNQKGILLSENKGTYSKALDCFTKGLQYEPNNYDIIYNKGRLLLKMNLFKKAIILFQECLEYNSNDSEALFEKAKAHAALYHKDEMLKDLKLAFTFSKDNYLHTIVRKGYPSFKYYHNDVEFQELIQASY